MNEPIITNGVSDNWFDSCHATASNFFRPIYSSFQLLFHFDSMNWIILELLLLLPVFFRLYGFGVQQKLSKFYTEARSQLIHFMFLFSLASVICPILQLFLPRSAGCITWDGLNYTPLRNGNYQSPSYDIVLITILLFLLISVEIGTWYIASTIAVFFFIAILLSSILSGSQTVSQALFSVAVASWLFFSFRFLPPIARPIAGITVFLFGFVYFIIEIVKLGRDDILVQACAVPGIRGCLLMVVNMALFFRYVFSQDNYNWFALSWHQSGESSSGSNIRAIIPGVIMVGSGDMFGKRLIKDIIDSSVAFIVVLICNEFVAKFFQYRLFSVA